MTIITILPRPTLLTHSNKCCDWGVGLRNDSMGERFKNTRERYGFNQTIVLVIADYSL